MHEKVFDILSHKEMHTKMLLRLHLTTVRIAIKKTTKMLARIWWGDHHTYAHILVQPLWKSVRRHLKKLKIARHKWLSL
jgi:hypothetical protein